MLTLSLLKRSMSLCKTASIGSCKIRSPCSCQFLDHCLSKNFPMVIGMFCICDLHKSSPGRLPNNKEVHLRFYLILLSMNSQASTVMSSIGLDFFFLYFFTILSIVQMFSLNFLSQLISHLCITQLDRVTISKGKVIETQL